MKKILIVVAGLCFTIMAVKAAEAEPKTPPASKPSKFREKYDKNRDGKIDDAERQAWLDDMKAEMLKKWDKNGDGKLDEAEKAAAKAEEKARLKAEAEAKKKQKADKNKPDAAPKKEEQK